MAQRPYVGPFFICKHLIPLLRWCSMTARVLPLLLPPLAFCLVLLSGCTRSSDDESPADNQSAEQRERLPRQSDAPRPEVESLPGVSLDGMSDAAKGIYLSTVNDLLSPCDEPRSLARCVSEPSEGSACRACLPAARYLARMATKGYGEDELRALYLNRYGEETKVDIPLEGAPIKGALMAPVTIVEFSDFQCPSCRHAAPLLDAAVRALDGRVRLVFKQFPLSHHPFSEKAARASLAAEKQGKFWEYHDLIFENQQRLNDLAFEAFARQLKLDLDRFKADFESQEIRERVSRDRSDGIAAGVNGTPAVYVNGREYLGALDDLVRYLEEELEA